MQGEASVPYTGIGGNNMDNRIMTLGLGGSTTPGIEDQSGTTVNARWAIPGGIINKGSWGYALVPGVLCSEENVENWLKGNFTATRPGIVSNYNYSDEELNDPAKEAEIEANVSAMLKKYVHDVLDAGDYPSFREHYAGCVYYV